jgi:hypothetical protein
MQTGRNRRARGRATPSIKQDVPNEEREWKIHMLNPGTREAMCGYPLAEWEYAVVTPLGFYWACCPSCREEFELHAHAASGFIHVGRPR